MTIPKSTVCPVCDVVHPSAADALRCWWRHDPDLSSRNTLAAVGMRIAMSRERVRQVLNGLGERRRAGQQRRPAPPHRRRSPSRPTAQRLLAPIAAVRDQPAPWLRATPATDLETEKRREYDRAREMTDHRRDYKRRRHQERMASDPAYRQARQEKGRRKYARRRARPTEGKAQQ